MKFTSEELLLAAEISKRARAIAAARTTDMTDEEAAVFKGQHWDEFIKAALEEFEMIAGVIATLRLQ